MFNMREINMKKMFLGLLVLVILISAVACGKEATMTTSVYSGSSAPAPEELRHEMGLDKSLPGQIFDEITGKSSTRATVITIPPATTTTKAYSTPAGGSETYNFDASMPVERMIIRNAYMALVVDDVSAAIAQISSLAAAYGGFVVSSNLYESDSRLYADISFRVDSTRFNEAMQTLRDLAVDVRSESTSGQDVTEEYVDLTAQLKNLEASESQLLELMKKAGEVAEILEVQRELTKTTGEIEQTKGRMQYLEESSSLALIQLNLEQSKLAVEFNADTRNVKEGNKVWFYAKISGGFAPYSYQWDFGDGQTSTQEVPSHNYRDNDTYTVTLKIKDDKENTAEYTREDYITVLRGWDAGNAFRNVWNAVVALGHFMFYVLIVVVIFCPVWIIILYFAWWRRRKKSR
jgi:hypothetical protein